MAEKDDAVSKIARGVRIDLVIALCALLISTLAAGASWWQARVLQTQTRVLQDQLGAQVWPYVSVTEGFRNDKAQISLSNDGLGPAILVSADATVDGVAKSNFIDILHAILGPNLVARSGKGEHISINRSLHDHLDRAPHDQGAAAAHRFAVAVEPPHHRQRPFARG